MKNKLLKLNLLGLFASCFIVLNAQESIVTSGGSATGSGGSASYSIGQMVYNTATGTNGSVAQGVQQAFEISTTLGVDDHLINLSFVAYPNPTNDLLSLKISNFNGNNTEYALFDLQGRLLIHQKIHDEVTQIPTQNLAQATYFLKVISGNKMLKIFKIIKN
jgi:hypothetical protein